MALATATLAGDAARRFAAALRVLWFAGYLHESWFGRAAADERAWALAAGQ